MAVECVICSNIWSMSVTLNKLYFKRTLFHFSKNFHFLVPAILFNQFQLELLSSCLDEMREGKGRWNRHDQQPQHKSWEKHELSNKIMNKHDWVFFSLLHVGTLFNS